MHREFSRKPNNDCSTDGSDNPKATSSEASPVEMFSAPFNESSSVPLDRASPAKAPFYMICLSKLTIKRNVFSPCRLEHVFADILSPLAKAMLFLCSSSLNQLVAQSIFHKGILKGIFSLRRSKIHQTSAPHRIAMGIYRLLYVR